MITIYDYILYDYYYRLKHFINFINIIVWTTFIIKRRPLMYYCTSTIMKDKSATRKNIHSHNASSFLFSQFSRASFSRRKRSLSKLYDCLEVDDRSSHAVPSSQNSVNFEFFLFWDTIDAFCRFVSLLFARNVTGEIREILKVLRNDSFIILYRWILYVVRVGRIFSFLKKIKEI